MALGIGAGAIVGAVVGVAVGGGSVASGVAGGALLEAPQAHETITMTNNVAIKRVLNFNLTALILRDLATAIPPARNERSQPPLRRSVVDVPHLIDSANLQAA